VVISFLGHDFETSIGAVAATLGNIGPGIGNVGPAFSYSEIAAGGKWFLSFLMLVGRLELFTVIVLFSLFSGKNRSVFRKLQGHLAQVLSHPEMELVKPLSEKHHRTKSIHIFQLLLLQQFESLSRKGPVTNTLVEPYPPDVALREPDL
jgi:hypothetical protein